jgi:diguanylate cyclase (GGDEF)-like protein/PAS domain S-box-containing protein
MRTWLIKAVAAPVFPGDEEKTRNARILNIVTLISLPLLSAVIPIMAFSNLMRASVIWFDAAFFICLLAIFYLIRRRKIDLAANGMIFLSFVWVTFLTGIQGTVRAPSTAYYVAVVVFAGLFFEWRGVLLSVIASSVAVLGMILAENAGLLPQPNYAVTFIQWINFTIVFFMTGFLSIFSSDAIRKSLQKAKKEIRERAAVEMELRKLIRAVEQSPASIVITNLDGEIEYVNPRFTQTTGYTLEEARGQNPRILKTDKTPTGTHADLWETLTDGREWHGEFVNRKKDGSFFYESATISPITNANGIATHYLAVKEDITERKQTADDLRQSREMYRLLAENISDVIWVLDLTAGCFRYVSPSVVRLRGFSVDEVLKQDMATALTPESALHLQEVLPPRIEAFQKGEQIPYVDELAQPCKDGAIVWTETTSTFEINLTNGHLEVYGVSRQVTERKRNQDLLQIRLRLLESSIGRSLDEFLESALDIISEFSGSKIVFYHYVEPDQTTLTLQAWSSRTLREFCQMAGKGMRYDVDEAGVWVDCVRTGKPVIHNDYAHLSSRKGLPPGHAEVIRELVVPVFRGEKVVSILGVGNKPGDYAEQDVIELTYLADVVWEISKRKQTEQRLNELQARLQRLTQNLQDAGLFVFSRDADGKSHYEYLSAGMENLTGIKIDEALADSSLISALILPEYAVKLREIEKNAAEGQEKFEFEFRQKHALTGEIHWMLMRAAPQKREDGTTIWYGVQMDITDRKYDEQVITEANDQLRIDMQKIEQLQTELREQSLRDPLTGLYNRRYLSETILREITRADREKRPVCFIMGDIDHFKKINDTYGHQVGDKFLVALANLMKENARGSDIVCRYGGEEFIMVLPGATIDSASRRAEELRQKCADLSILHDGKTLRITISFGVALYPDHGRDAEEVIQKTDKAMYISKETGRNRVTVWQDIKLPPR